MQFQSVIKDGSLEMGIPEHFEISLNQGQSHLLGHPRTLNCGVISMSAAGPFYSLGKRVEDETLAFPCGECILSATPSWTPKLTRGLNYGSQLSKSCTRLLGSGGGARLHTTQGNHIVQQQTSARNKSPSRLWPLEPLVADTLWKQVAAMRTFNKLRTSWWFQWLRLCSQCRRARFNPWSEN